MKYTASELPKDILGKTTYYSIVQTVTWLHISCHNIVLRIYPMWNYSVSHVWPIELSKEVLDVIKLNVQWSLARTVEVGGY